METAMTTLRKSVPALLALAVLGLLACEGVPIDKRTQGQVLGGATGAVLGSTIGGGTGQLVAVGAGAVLGTMVGGNIGERM